MASPDVCITFPKMTWSTSAGSTFARVSASFETWTARSVAETSASAPLYSAIGVRTPSTRTMDSVPFISVLLLERAVRRKTGRVYQRGSVSKRRGRLVKAPAKGVHVDRSRVGMNPVREEDEDPARLGVDE